MGHILVRQCLQLLGLLLYFLLEVPVILTINDCFKECFIIYTMRCCIVLQTKLLAELLLSLFINIFDIIENCTNDIRIYIPQ